jgi:hypothetical protein
MVWYVKSVEIVMFVEIVKMVKSVWIVLIVSGFALSPPENGGSSTLSFQL